MDDQHLLSVGQFARRAGLSIYALRHYDALGLLTPASTDAASGYRRYSPQQLSTARLVAHLRWLSLPLAQVRLVLADPHGPIAQEVLAAHAEHLVRERDHLQRQIEQCTTQATEGVHMPQPTTTVTPVQVKIAVHDLDEARRFYEAAFALSEQVIRRTDEEDFTGFQFGQTGFFLLVLIDQRAFDAPGRATLGLLVPDVDASHRQALAAGAVEVVGLTDAEGMPRTSAVTDPDGNWVWLYQG